jgi:hypothetical protein
MLKTHKIYLYTPRKVNICIYTIIITHTVLFAAYTSIGNRGHLGLKIEDTGNYRLIHLILSSIKLFTPNKDGGR